MIPGVRPTFGIANTRKKTDIIDKTAAFVARNGLQFEQKILKNEASNPIFSFLQPTDPDYAYYRSRIRELKGEKASTRPAPQTLGTQEAKPVQIKKPDPEEWILDLPELSALDLEIIKLSAQYIAKNGEKFEVGLMKREHKSQQFDFLKPTHHLHPFYRQLVDSYTRVIMPPASVTERLRKWTDKTLLVEKLKNRVEWEKQQQKLQEQEDLEKKRKGGICID